ncbi:MAG TPA: MerR family transcriptional regulator [Clostridiales bacterium]|nr:MerR family transcriptional regulator [Clostridiales bacterium]
MDIRNCKSCGKIFLYQGISICPACSRERDRQYEIVRDYLYENPGANIVEVSEATGVEEDVILMFLKEGRLQLAKPGIGLNCERCGVPITTGRLCDNCVKEIKTEAKEITKTELNNAKKLGSGGERMHVLDRIKYKKR